MNNRELQFKKLYDANYPKVKRLCLGYVGGDETLASDVVQEVFVKVWENLDSFRKESAVSTWIYRITVNTCLTQLKKSKYVSKNLATDLVGDVNDAAISHQKEKMLVQMYACINSLSETNKAIILLELEGLPQKEIADVIGIKHEAIRTRIHRIKNELTKCVHHE